MPFKIRILHEADIPGVIRLWKSCDLIRPWNDPMADITQGRASGSAEFFIGEMDQQIVASAMAGDDGHRGWLYYVAVDPADRNRGFGRAIVAAAESWLKARGREKTQLMVRAENTGVREFYAAIGYGEQPRIIMARWLDGRPLTP